MFTQLALVDKRLVKDDAPLLFVDKSKLSEFNLSWIDLNSKKGLACPCYPNLTSSGISRDGSSQFSYLTCLTMKASRS